MGKKSGMLHIMTLQCLQIEQDMFAIKERLNVLAARPSGNCQQCGRNMLAVQRVMMTADQQQLHSSAAVSPLSSDGPVPAPRLSKVMVADVKGESHAILHVSWSAAGQIQIINTRLRTAIGGGLPAS